MQGDRDIDDRLTSAEKMLEVLMAVGELGVQDGGATRLADVVTTTGFPRPTTHRLLSQLKQAGFVSQEPSGPYRLGPKVLLLAAQALGGLDVRRIANPAMQAFCDRFGHTVHLGIRDGVDVVYIDKAEARQGTQVGSKIGQRRPIPVTALGKALLAYSEPHVVEQVVAAGWPRRTSNSVATAAALMAQLVEVRSTGAAFDDEESDLGLRCAAAAIFDHNGQPIAAISVTTLVSQVDRDGILRLARELTAVARDISATLTGARPPA